MGAAAWLSPTLVSSNATAPRSAADARRRFTLSSSHPDAAPVDRDPDVRFLLANERTLLAWVRTAVVLQAGGIGVLQFVTGFQAHGVVGLVMLALGALTAVTGVRRYRAADRAIRRQQLPARGVAPELVTLAVVALSGVLAAAYLVGRFA